MAATAADAAAQNYERPPKIAIVTGLPSLASTSIGEMYLLKKTGATDNNKIHIRVPGGWLKTAALT